MDEVPSSAVARGQVRRRAGALRDAPVPARWRSSTGWCATPSRTSISSSRVAPCHRDHRRAGQAGARRAWCTLDRMTERALPTVMRKVIEKASLSWLRHASLCHAVCRCLCREPAQAPDPAAESPPMKDTAEPRPLPGWECRCSEPKRIKKTMGRASDMAHHEKILSQTCGFCNPQFAQADRPRSKLGFGRLVGRISITEPSRSSETA